LPASQTVATAQITPTICQGQHRTMYSECSILHPNLITFGRVIAERMKTAKLHPKLNPILGRSLASSRVITTAKHYLTARLVSSSLKPAVAMIYTGVPPRISFGTRADAYCSKTAICSLDSDGLLTNEDRPAQYTQE